MADDESGEVKPMRFRLIYMGELKATQRPHLQTGQEKHVFHKHSIRKQFHVQLRRLWESDRFLQQNVHPQHYGVNISAATIGGFWGPDENERRPLSMVVSALYQENNYRFVPLVRKDWDVNCSLEILLLRQDGINTAFSAGDLDNRVKTLIDALTKPTNAAQLEGHEEPAEDEAPFYCLLENDRLVTALKVETDTLLTPLDGNGVDDLRQAIAVISVEIRPTYVTMFNVGFAS